MAKIPPSLWFSLTILGVAITPASASIGVYFSPPDVETAIDSAIMGTTTEDFNARTSGTSLGNSYLSSATGITYSTTTGTVDYIANDAYGGYGEGTYLGVRGNSSAALSLSVPAQYFGLYFTAGDPSNLIQIYSGNTLVLSFSTASVLNRLPRNGTVTAIDGSVYQTNDYYGQPVSNSNGNEAYAYLHFIADQGTNFDRIVLSQGNTGAIFENDNHSLRATAPAIPGSLVAVVPEPSTWAMFALGGLAFIGVAARRRKSPES